MCDLGKLKVKVVLSACFQSVSAKLVCLALPASPSRLVCREQHRSWCTLGFVRSIALTPHMCAALSSPPWISLLVKVVEGHSPFTAASLQRQVTNCAATLIYAHCEFWDWEPHQRWHQAGHCNQVPECRKELTQGGFSRYQCILSLLSCFNAL